ncbi:MAG: ABC transporter ATP-binding protein [Proteobacteria bacterium ST_bin15]|nr:MAG: ABC transporter ATP-binding protein [Proteobacteria bacterium ST_bin15]
MTALLQVQGITHRFRGLLALDQVSLQVEAGRIFALIGPNGAGKTTLFNLISGALKPDQGRIIFGGERIDGLAPHLICRRGLARTFQIVRPFPAMTVHENVVIGAMLHCADMDAAHRHADDVLRQLDLAPRRAERASSLTLPDRKRLEVARALATSPRLLLLDEVMAGLRPSEIDRIVAILRNVAATGVTLLLIEHVMRAVAALADHVHVLNHGATIAAGRLEEIARHPKVIESYLGTEAAS